MNILPPKVISLGFFVKHIVSFLVDWTRLGETNEKSEVQDCRYYRRR